MTTHEMDFFCVRRHIGLFLIFWMSLSKRPSTSSAQAIQALNKASTISLRVSGRS
jgi:hypothetical protein